MSADEKFQAAVNVIRSLPKSGSYQPSHDVMLRFYSYFKQATEGKCNVSKPKFWDIVGRAKWEAWNCLGNMPSNKAKELYVAELQKIVETMAYTDNVAAFFDTVDEDIPSISKDDLELVAGDILRKFKSPSSSTESSQNNSPLRASVQQNGHYESDDEFIDTVDSEESENQVTHIVENGYIPNGPSLYSKPHHDPIACNKTNEINSHILEELRRTISSMEKDINILKQRMNSVENPKPNKKSILWVKPSWWPIKEVSPAVCIAFLLWPVAVNYILGSLRRKQRS